MSDEHPQTFKYCLTGDFTEVTLQSIPNTVKSQKRPYPNIGPLWFECTISPVFKPTRI